MVIKGKERHMLLTVGATKRIAPMCPNGDFKKVFEISDGKTYNDTIDDDIKMAVILVNAYENSAALENGTEPDLVSFEDINQDAITPVWVRSLEEEIISVLKRDLFGEIETEEVKKNEVNAEKKST